MLFKLQRLDLSLNMDFLSFGFFTQAFLASPFPRKFAVREFAFGGEPKHFENQ
jgi:hypothetical protein